MPPRREGSTAVGAALLVLGACIAVPSTARAEAETILVVALVRPPATCEALDAEELAGAVRVYLSEVGAGVREVDEPFPRAPFEEVRGRAIDLARREGVALVAWGECGSGQVVFLHILDARGAAALVRTVDVGPEPPSTLSRTMAAILRGVVETGLLDRAARAESEPAEPAGGPAGDRPPDRVEPDRGRPALSAALGYVLRLGQAPGPNHHALAARLWLMLLDRLVLAAGGRYAFPEETGGQPGGSAARSGAVLGLGVGHRLGRALLAGVASLDVEWLWGEARAGDGRPLPFDAMSFGLTLEAVTSVRLVLGLELWASASLTVRPERVVFTVGGVEVASSGHVEGGLEIGLGWRFL